MNKTKKKLHKTFGNIIFVILTCFHLMNFFGETKWLMKICHFGPASFPQRAEFTSPKKSSNKSKSK
jgi:hypothetical protein